MGTLVIPKLLAQRTPASTTKSPIYSPPDSTRTRVETILVANTTSSADAYSIYLNSNGSTLDDSVALYRSMAVSANATHKIEFTNGIYLNNTNATLGVESATASAITFSVFGEETTTT